MDPREMQRQNRRFGDIIRAVVGCPLCRSVEPEVLPVRVIAYRHNTVRIMCRVCELRFSVRWDDLTRAISRDPDSFLNAYAGVIYSRHLG